LLITSYDNTFALSRTVRLLCHDPPAHNKLSGNKQFWNLRAHGREPSAPRALEVARRQISRMLFLVGAGEPPLNSASEAMSAGRTTATGGHRLLATAVITAHVIPLVETTLRCAALAELQHRIRLPMQRKPDKTSEAPPRNTC
jgi:hypothetical protein